MRTFVTLILIGFAAVGGFVAGLNLGQEVGQKIAQREAALVRKSGNLFLRSGYLVLCGPAGPIFQSDGIRGHSDVNLKVTCEPDNWDRER